MSLCLSSKIFPCVSQIRTTSTLTLVCMERKTMKQTMMCSSVADIETRKRKEFRTLLPTQAKGQEPVARATSLILKDCRPCTTAQQAAGDFMQGSPQLIETCKVTAPTKERKRALGTSYATQPHRQERLARFMLTAEEQMRKSALPPLVTQEREPGQTLAHLLHLPHPFANQIHPKYLPKTHLNTSPNKSQTTTRHHNS